jgi:hypothetical protein
VICNSAMKKYDRALHLSAVQALLVARRRCKRLFGVACCLMTRCAALLIWLSAERKTLMPPSPFCNKGWRTGRGIDTTGYAVLRYLLS